MPGNGKYKEWITDDGLMQLKAWARDGLTDRQIASNIGISPQTLSDWKKKYKRIGENIKEGRAPVWAKVEDSFYSRCEWREVEEITTETFQSVDGKKTVKVTKHKRWLPPDTACMIFAMKNLRPKKWRDKPEVSEDEITGDDGLIEALTACATGVFDGGDDGSILPDREET